MKHRTFFKTVLLSVMGLICIAAYADDRGVYSLYIEDSFGVTVYTSAQPANGMEYDYDLSGIGEGLFRLVLSGPSGEYEGYFTIHD